MSVKIPVKKRIKRNANSFQVPASKKLVKFMFWNITSKIIVNLSVRERLLCMCRTDLSFSFRFINVPTLVSVADPTCHFDPDPALHFDPFPDPTFHFDANLDPNPDPSFQIKGQNCSNRLIFHTF
jgi:hypothetical protein